KVFNWVGTMYRGAITFKTPFAYICGFLYFLVFGGMTGIALATTPLDIHWHDTYFVVAHFHFFMVGASVMAFMAALHYWFPKMFGRVYHEGWGLVAASLIILGFNATFIPQFLLGNYGMPRRYYQYPEHFQALNVASTAGATLLGFGFVIIVIFLATEILLFGGLFCGYAVYRFQFQLAFAECSRHLNLTAGTVNTLVLITSSLTVALAIHFARTNRQRAAVICLVLTILFALGFLGIKAIEYTEHFHERALPGKYYAFEAVKVPGAAMFYSLYFLMTGLHGLHVVIGMSVLAWILWRTVQGRYSSKYYTGLELGGLYW